MNHYSIKDFEELFTSEIYPTVINTLVAYDLISDNRINTRKHETKKFLVHFVILYVIRFLEDKSIDHPLIYVKKDLFTNSELDLYGSTIVFKKIIKQTLKTLCQKYPEKFLFSKNNFANDYPDNVRIIQNHVLKFVQPCSKGLNVVFEELRAAK